MHTNQLAEYAGKFAELLQHVDRSVSIEYKVSDNNFLSVYNKPLERYPKGGGVYVFRVQGEIVYIGKAGDFSRIWGHVGIPEDVDGRQEFSNCRFVTDPYLNRVSAEVKEQFRLGNFFIDCFIVTPADLCGALETFLQSVYWLTSDRKHPPANRQIG